MKYIISAMNSNSNFSYFFYDNIKFELHDSNGSLIKPNPLIRPLEKTSVKMNFFDNESINYWNDIKISAETYVEKYPYVILSAETSGIYLTDDTVEWLDEMDFRVTIKNDGQKNKEINPLENKKQREIIKRLFDKLIPTNRISFKTTINKENFDRISIQQYFESIFGSSMFLIKENTEKNIEFDTPELYAEYRTLVYQQLKSRKILKFEILALKFEEWINHLALKEPLKNNCFSNCSNIVFSEEIPFFGMIFEYLTGYMPLKIQAEDGSLPIEKQYLWTIINNNKN